MERRPGAKRTHFPPGLVLFLTDAMGWCGTLVSPDTSRENPIHTWMFPESGSLFQTATSPQALRGPARCLPVPVAAQAQMSFPRSPTGMQAFWMGVGCLKPRAVIAYKAGQQQEKPASATGSLLTHSAFTQPALTSFAPLHTHTPTHRAKNFFKNQ